MQVEHEKFIDLSEKFSDKLNKVILPIRLGIYSLYSTKKVSIFNESMIDILDYYIGQNDFKHVLHGRK